MFQGRPSVRPKDSLIFPLQRTPQFSNPLCLQEAERKIPINYASRYKVGALSRQSYLPDRAGW
jgi:hypothetical protein